MVRAREEISENILSLKEGKSDKKSILIELANAYEKTLKSIEASEITKELRLIYENEIKLIIEKWDSEKKKTEKDVEEIKRKLGEERLQPEKLEELTKKSAQIENIIKDFKKYEQHLEILLKERDSIKDKIKELRHELFRLRDEEVSKINKELKNRVRIKVTFEGERKGFKSLFSNLLAGSGLQKDAIAEIVEKESIVVDGLLLSVVINEGIESLKKKFNLTEKMAERLIKHFQDKNKLFELETLFPDDLVIIELNIDERFYPLEKLSPGQRATALLFLLFILKENTILIMDQPEEDLDNRFIYEDVVKILRELKGKRQFIIATHNANIPVLGDSESILVLDKKDDRCIINDCGSIDKKTIIENVKRIMEGGDEAFRRRAEKYGGKYE